MGGNDRQVVGFANRNWNGEDLMLLKRVFKDVG